MVKFGTISEEALRSYAGDTIYKRGIVYYQKGKVVKFKLEGDRVKASVQGHGGYYDVVLNFEKNGYFNMHCSCPYDWGPLCKHEVAVILKYNDYINGKEKSFETDKTQSWKNMMKKESDNEKFGFQRHENSKIVFRLILNNDIWEIQAIRRYLKKDGSFGRMMNINSWEISEDGNSYGASASEIVVLKYMSSIGFGYSQFVAGFRYGTDFGQILRLLKDSSVYYGVNLNKSVKFNDEYKLRFILEKNKKDYLFKLQMVNEKGESIPVNNRFKLLTVKPVQLISRDYTVYQVESRLEARFILPFTKQESPLEIKKKEIGDFIKKVYPEINSLADDFSLPDELKLKEITQLTGRALYLSEKDGELFLKPVFRYGDNKIEVDALPFKSSAVINSEEGNYLIRRQQRAEKIWLELLEEHRLIYDTAGEYRIKGKKNPIEWMFESLPVFSERGFDIYGEDKLDKLKINRSRAKIVSNVSSGQDWFDLEVKIDFDGVTASYFEVVKALKKNKKYIRLNNGAYVALSDEIIEKLGFIGAFSEKDRKNNKLRFSMNQALILNEVINFTVQSKADENFKKQVEKLKSFRKIESAPLPEQFKGKLRPYQKAGLDWLTFLRDYNFGGCLADDMGLGKTIQALALLQNEKNENKGVSLIVAPTSVISNWGLEAEHFTPQLKVYLHHGKEREKNREILIKNDIIVTSYALLWRDFEIFKDMEFNYIILDESQKIKNPFSLTAKAARSLTAEHRLVMTGTPIENNLTELWSQFQFINPGMLGNNKNFQSGFAKSIEKYGDKDKTEQLKRIIYPFILRRKKEDVLKELPPKVENITFCDMDEHHEREYIKWRDYYRMEILGQIEEKGMAKSKMKILEGLTRLRQLSIHPKLVNEEYKKTSAKMEALQSLLEEVVSEGHKVLVFSQFVKALAIIRQYLDNEGIAYAYLDGRTKKRQNIVDEFQTNDKLKIFLISLKAGGLGLNLTAADYVIHVDPWWNPAVENQANDRAHRMGQKKKVFVYKLITKGTVEEKILKLQEKKKGLANELISSDAAFIKNISKKDIEHLFS